MRSRRDLRGFSLIELMVVISILSLLFPVLVEAKRATLRSSCQSNLHQIGLGFHLYANDSDDLCPNGVDRFRRDNPEFMPEPHPPVGQIPDIVPLLLPYTRSRLVFRCPCDTQPFTATANEARIADFPSVFNYAGTSYSFWAPDYFGQSLTVLSGRKGIRLCLDSLVPWHTGVETKDVPLLMKSVNSLFPDGRVEFTPKALLER